MKYKKGQRTNNRHGAVASHITRIVAEMPRLHYIFVLVKETTQ